MVYEAHILLSTHTCYEVTNTYVITGWGTFTACHGGTSQNCFEPCIGHPFELFVSGRPGLLHPVAFEKFE